VWIAAVGSVNLFPNLEAALKGVFNRVLTTLNLAANSIGDEGAKAIADSLKSGMAVLNFFPNASTRPKVITLWEVQSFRFLNASHFFPTSFHIGRHAADGSQNMHRATRPLRGSVSCGSGWSVPCVSIQLTLSQNMLSRAAHMSKRAQRRRHPPSRRQARTRDRAVMAGTLSHGTTAARGLRLTACMRTSPPTRSNYPRWRESAHSSAGAGCSGASPSTCVLRSVTHCGPILSLSRARQRVLKGRLRKCLPRADSSLRGPPHGGACPHNFRRSSVST
jgi:hypothetical protein